MDELSGTLRMGKMPKITVVSPSFNQGRFIAETIESLMDQDYPCFEHIVIDGGSTDQTLSILRRYPHLIVVSEPDRGQAEAINKGFRLATGEIWGFLNSDDTLLPGALKRVAQEIDPEQERHIVMGRCRFVDENGDFTGIEHPSHFESHRRILAIWKGYTLPQPAVFWTPEVWKVCGPMDEGLKFSLDYDLFCRFSREYPFHFVDQVLATYRLHPESKTEQWTERQRLEDAIRISRRYWGSPWALKYWLLTFSLGWYRFNRTGRALAFYRQGQEHWRQHRHLQGAIYASLGGMLAPDVAFYAGVYPVIRNSAARILLKAFEHFQRNRRRYPQTLAYLDHTDPWSDGWAGPRLVVMREAHQTAQAVSIQGFADLTFLSAPLTLTLFVNGQRVGEKRFDKSGDFLLEFPLPHPLESGRHAVEVQASSWFVRHSFARNRDFRPLSFRMGEIHFHSAVGEKKETTVQWKEK